MSILKKIFGMLDASAALPDLDPAQLERILAEIAIDPPQAEWIALVRSNGLFLASFPAGSEVDSDRVSAMSAAMASLGERITSELNDGAFQYAILGGADRITLMIALNSDFLLTVGLGNEISVDAFLRKMKSGAMATLMAALHANPLTHLSGFA